MKNVICVQIVSWYRVAAYRLGRCSDRPPIAGHSLYLIGEEPISSLLLVMAFYCLATGRSEMTRLLSYNNIIQIVVVTSEYI